MNAPAMQSSTSSRPAYRCEAHTAPDGRGVRVCWERYSDQGEAAALASFRDALRSEFPRAVWKSVTVTPLAPRPLSEVGK